MTILKQALAMLALLLATTAASAQSWGEALKTGASLAPDLSFPAEAQSLGLLSPNGMAIYKPEGAGPFPALVIHHSCGGVRSEILDWAKLAYEKGYVVFVLDSLGPRGLKTNCYPPTTVYPSRGLKDAMHALAHLKTFPFVDKDRIGFIGFSWGASVGLLASSDESASAFGAGDRFTAVVAAYPMCYFGGTQRIKTTVEYLRLDTNKPLLVLMGEADNETPPADCLRRLEELKGRSMPVEWYVYPGTTHCWNCSSINGQSKVDFQGNRVIYRYSREATEDSVKRAFDFFAKHLATKG